MLRSRVPALAAVVAAVVVAAGCGSSDDDTSSSANESSSAKSTQPFKTIMFVNPLPAYPDWGVASKCFESAAKKIGAKPIVTGPTGLKSDSGFMIERLQQGIAQKVDAIVTVPFDPPAFTPVLTQAKQKGILLATLNTGKTTTLQDVNLGTDYAHNGRVTADGVAAKGGQLNVGIIGLAARPPGTDIEAGFKEAIKKHPNVKVVAQEYDDGDPTKDIAIATAMMRAHPELNMIWAYQGASVPGVITAIKEQKKVGKVFLVTNDLAPQTRAGLEAGIVYGTNLQDFCGMGRGAVEKLAAIKRGERPPRYIDTGARFVTKDNAPAETGS
jgi:ribose transport system substrate-binding protein